MGKMFLVPVQISKAGALAVRTGRLPTGERVGLAFTSESAICQTLGPSQQWIRLAARALADMLAPLGVEQITIDPGRGRR
jgi:SseB protein N-terminal domain